MVYMHLKDYDNFICLFFNFFGMSSFYIFFLNYFIVFQVQLLVFTPHHSPQPQPNSPHSLASSLPLGFVPVSFIIVLENSSPHCPFPLPSGYCQIILNFSVSGYILFAFFLLLIMLQLKVRSYGIYPSPPGLFHLA